jgi:hypothetical protein
MTTFRAVAMLALCLAWPHAADAQWYVAGYLGANHTLPATVTIDQPSRATSLQFNDVTFEARPFESPQYYGVRVGRLFGVRRHFGVEFEWFHPKVYAQTARDVLVAGQFHAVTVNGTLPMNTIVQRYSMSHGMNFALINGVVRFPLSDAATSMAGRIAVTGRAGAGPMIPHGESEVAGETVEQYEVAGIGYQVAGGATMRLYRGLSALAEYKFGHASPEITIVDGTGQTTANLHQVAFGLAVEFGH